MALIEREKVWELVGEMAETVRPGSKLEGVMRRYANAIDNAPAVDAIPVEWLEYMQMESMSENDRTMVGAIEAILIEWHIYVNRLREMDRQKEQEAQDG